MSLSLTNRADIVANSYSLITDNGPVNLVTHISETITGIPPSTLNTLEELATAMNNNPQFFEDVQTSMDTKAPIINPTFTENITVNGELKSEIIRMKNAFGLTVKNQLGENVFDLNDDDKSAVFYGNVTGISKSMINLGNVDNTSDLNKPISTATQSALDLKENLVSLTLPLRRLINFPSGDTTIAIDETEDLTIANLTASEDITVNGELQAEVIKMKNAYGLTIKNQTGSNVFDLNDDDKSAVFYGNVTGISKIMVDLGNVDNTSDLNKPISNSTQSILNTKMPIFDLGTNLEWSNILGPGNLILNASNSSVTKSTIGLGNVDNTSDLNKPVSTLQQTALNLKANIDNSAFTGDTTAVGLTVSNDLSVNGEIKAEVIKMKNAYGLTIKNQTGLNVFDLNDDDKSAVFYGPVGGLSKSMVDLGNVDNTSDLNKPISTAVETALDNKETIFNVVAPIQKGINIGTGSWEIKLDPNRSITTAQQTALNNKETIFNVVAPIQKGINIGTGSWEIKLDPNRSITTAQQTALDNKETIFNVVAPIQKGINIGTGSWEIKLDANRSITTAQQTALDLKANLASPTFTGTVGGLNKSMVQLGNVDDTTDLNKPISTAVQAALDLKANITNPTFSGDITINGEVKSEVLKMKNAFGLTVKNQAGLNVLDLNDDDRSCDFYGDVIFPTILTTPIIKSPGAAHITVRTSADSNICRFFNTGGTQIYSTLQVDGALTLGSFYAHKNYVGCYINGGAVSFSNGFVSSGNITISARSANTAYVLNFTAHPAGTSYLPFVQPRTPNTGTAPFFATCTNSTSSSCTIWLRDVAGNVVDGSFFFHTCP